MGKKAKRAPGGGRKPQGDFDQLSSSPFSVRMPDRLRKQLEAAAEKSVRSAGQELLRRLDDSFRRDYSKDRDPGTRALSFLLAELIQKIQWGGPPYQWQSSPFLFRAVKVGFAQLLKAIEPEGETSGESPFLAMAEAIRERARGAPHEKQAIQYANEMARSRRTPERAGNKAAAEILSELYYGALPEIEKWSRIMDRVKEDEGDRKVAARLRDRAVRTHYGMQDVMRDLQLTSKRKNTGD